MAGSQKGFYWKADSLNKVLENNIRRFPVTLDRAVSSAVEFEATRGESYMREQAPWTDQTGNARNGLHTTTHHEPLKGHQIVFAHGVSYGIWLEVRFDGKYSIIPAAVLHTGQELMNLLNGLFAKLGGQL